MSDFCIFVLTHGRPDRVHTYHSLRKAGYTGRMYVVIDDEDDTEGEYRRRFGDDVLQFCKADVAAATDEGDNFDHRNAVLYARNACWQLAESVGCQYFCQMDDDYMNYQLRFDSDNNFCSPVIYHTMDDVIEALLVFFKTTGAAAIAMSQAGDHIGGGVLENGTSKQNVLKRKCMNSWFCDVDKKLNFVGHMNEDVTCYVVNGRQGRLFFTVTQAQLNQALTQAEAGGMSDLYLDAGTYVKSFYTVMAAPSCVRIGTMGDPRSGRYRIHHRVNWNNAAPKILHEQHRNRK